MISEEYDIIPANQMCKSQINTSHVISTPGTTTHANQNAVNTIEQQHIEDSKYDNVNDMDVKPLYGGKHKQNKQNMQNKQTKDKPLKKNLKNYNIEYKNKLLRFKEKNEKDVLLKFINKYNINKQYLIQINETKNNKHIKESLYLIKKI